jgi:hypothetical protein
MNYFHFFIPTSFYINSHKLKSKEQYEKVARNLAKLLNTLFSELHFHMGRTMSHLFEMPNVNSERT